MHFHSSYKYTKSYLCSILFILVLRITCSSADAKLKVSTHDLTFQVSSTDDFSVFLSEPVDFPVPVDFTYSEGRSIYYLPNNYTITNSTEVLKYNVRAFKAGHTTVTAKTNASGIYQSPSLSFVRISVFKIDNLNLVSAIIGWLYFICWSISFYPQIIDNWRRKSVVGLNFDFLGLNLTGFIAYSVFNIGLRFSNEVKAEYHSLHPTGVIPVEINDVVFAVHAVFATVVTIGQCFIYERGNQLIAIPTVAALAVAWSTAGVFLLITALGLNNFVPWLTFLYFFSYVKLLVTLTKYIPQVVYNWKRKSTVGWSIGTVLLDFIGGLFSITQMFIIAYNYNDWHSIFGNFTKFGLGVASVTFDVIFMVQHYCLYPNNNMSRSRESLIDRKV